MSKRYQQMKSDTRLRVELSDGRVGLTLCINFRQISARLGFQTCMFMFEIYTFTILSQKPTMCLAMYEHVHSFGNQRIE